MWGLWMGLRLQWSPKWDCYCFLFLWRTQGRDFLIKIQGNIVTFIPKSLTTRCKKSTKRPIELGELPLLNPCRGFIRTRCKKPSFSNTLFCNMFAHLIFLTFWKTMKSFSLLSTITVGWHREVEPAIQGSKNWRGCRLRNHWLTIVLFSHKNRQISRITFI